MTPLVTMSTVVRELITISLGLALGSDLLRAQTTSVQDINDVTNAEAVRAEARIPSAERGSSGRLQVRTAAQLQSTIYDTNRLIATFTDQLSDLTNWGTHIEIATSEVRNTDATASGEISDRAKALM